MRRSEGFFLKGGDETPKMQGTEKWGVNCSEVQCSEVKSNDGSEVK